MFFADVVGWHVSTCFGLPKIVGYSTFFWENAVPVLVVVVVAMGGNVFECGHTRQDFWRWPMNSKRKSTEALVSDAHSQARYGIQVEDV